MIMLRSNAATKITKPPPPVPPRPSKTILAEALAKTRKENVPTTNGRNNINPVVKSQSYSSINNYKNIVQDTHHISNIERSISEEDKPKPATRTLVYQSANLNNAKKGNIEEIRVNVARNTSIKRDNNISRTSSFKSANVSRNNSVKIDLGVKSIESIADVKHVDGTGVVNNVTECNRVTQDRFEVVGKTFENHIEVGRLINKPFNGIVKDLSTADSSLESFIESDDAKLSRSSSFKTNEVVSSLDSILSDDDLAKLDDNSNEINDRNHVNTLIDEMFASVLDIPEPMVQVVNDYVVLPDTYEIDLLDDNPQKTVLVIDTDESKKVRFNNEVTELATPQLEIPEIDFVAAAQSIDDKLPQPKIDDQFNHELLISELSNMKLDQQHRIAKRQRKPSLDFYDNNGDSSKIQHSDWVVVNNGEEVRLSSCQITIENGPKTEIHSRFDEMSNLHGLPPLPKSLSGFNLIESPQTPGRPGSSRNISPATHTRSSSNESSLKKGSSNVDAKLALLRREMYSLRQLDLSLLSQLWSLNESIQDFRHILQEQDERSILSPPSPSPTPSSGEDADGDEFYTPSPIRFRPAPPPPPQRRPSNSSSGTGSSV